jgi:hypothetical protein
VFRFEQQEKLHEEIIDSGLARIYQGHLDVAARLAHERGVEIGTRLLAGKSFEKLLQHARETRPFLLLAGRIGVHSEAGMDLGSATENLLRQAPCNLLLSARSFEPPVEHIAQATMAWSEEAEQRIARVPEFARGMARKAVVKHAAQLGHTIVTSDVIDALMATIPAGAVDHYASKHGVASEKLQGAGSRCPFAPRREEEAGAALSWQPEALARLERIQPAAVREHARLRIEKAARLARRASVDAALVDEAEQALHAALG